MAGLPCAVSRLQTLPAVHSAKGQVVLLRADGQSEHGRKERRRSENLDRRQGGRRLAELEHALGRHAQGRPRVAHAYRGSERAGKYEVAR